MSDSCANGSLPGRTRVQAIYRCTQHLRVWLAAADALYGQAARAGFARAHPDLFGHAYEVALRGYEHWRMRRGLNDAPESFARYLARRHERWLISIGHDGCTVAPCLLGSGTRKPCWHIG